MLEKPNLADQKIIDCLQLEYGLHISQVNFLPLGADFNTAVYRAITNDNIPYFLKLRSGVFAETAVTLPKYLYDQGIQQIIPPLAAKSGRLWGNLNSFKMILYPFIDGRNGYEVTLTDRHWAEFGTTLKKIHAANVPSYLTRHIHRETYGPQARQIVSQFLTQIENRIDKDPIASQMIAFLQSKQVEILDLIARAQHLAQKLQAAPPDLIVCHSDLHAGNLFIADNTLYIVDWDEPILAPKERDLMYIGGGLLASGLTPLQEETAFYQAYGPTKLDPTALAYYRYERIIQDIAEYCKQLLVTEEGGEDLIQSLHYLKSNFLPNKTIDIAYQSDKSRFFDIG